MSEFYHLGIKRNLLVQSYKKIKKKKKGGKKDDLKIRVVMIFYFAPCNDK